MRTERFSPSRLSIRQALTLGLGVMAVGVTTLVVVLVEGERRLDQARARLYAQSRVADAVERGVLALLEARRHERDFMLRQMEFGINEARSRYLPLFELRMGDLDAALDKIRNEDGEPQTRAAIDEAQALSRGYRVAFRNMAELSAMRGSMNSGLMGLMRRKGDAIEAELPRGSEGLLAEMLRLRRAKTEYIRSGGMQHALVFREAAERFAARVGASGLAPQARQAILGHLGQFTRHFEEYVSLSERISADITRFRDAAGGIQPLLDGVQERALERQDLARRDLLAVTRGTTRITIALQVLGLVLACLMAAVLYRKIARMIRKVEDFSARIGAQDFSARYATLAGGESARLAGALNSMADDLQRAEETMRRYESELAKSQRMKAELLSSMSHELKTPLHAIVGLAQLLQSGGAGPLDPRQRECADQITASGMQLAQLVDRMLAATRLDSGMRLQEAPGSDLPSLLDHATGAHASPAAPAPAAAPPASSSLVLLVDDHPVNRTVLARQLQALGYECEEAADGSEALGKWRAGGFGLVITDCDMPVMDGYELARQVRAIEADEGRPRTPIIACSAKDPAGEAERCREAGMDDYIGKPFALATLRGRLEHWAPRREPLPPAEARREDASPPFDPAVLAEISGGDANFEREVVAHFLGANAEDAALLAHAVERKEVDQLVHAAHRMKGASRTLGATDFAQACARLEAAGRAGDWNAVSEKLAAFHLERERLGRYLKAGHPGEAAD